MYSKEGFINFILSSEECLRADRTARQTTELGRFSTGRVNYCSPTTDPLIAYETSGRDAALSVATPDHYPPLLYVIAQQRDGDKVSFPVQGFDGGSVSMLSVKIG